MQFYFQTDVGRKRNSNQDYAGMYQNEAHYALAILADGMGGHQAGDVASEVTVEDLGAKWQQDKIVDSQQAATWFVDQIQKENELIYQKGQADPLMQGMGTTVVTAAFFEDEFTIGHVGDSRAYGIKGAQIKQLTEDHSLVNALLKSGEITKEMAAVHPRRNVLTRSVGMPGTVEVDVTTYPKASVDYLLLASDGLTNMVSDEEILQVVTGTGNLEEKVRLLIQMANEAGGVDNITVVLVEMGGTL